jgi:ABC-type nitrate/sulfonate/bicarbonate transport system substrate-binding protein
MALSPLDRRSFLKYSGLAVGGAALLAACGDDAEATGSTPSASGTSAATASFGTAAVQLSWIKNVEFAGEYFADSKGYFTQAGFSKVDLLAGGPAGIAAEAALATGKAFVGLSSPTITAPAILQGAPLKVVGATFQKNPFCIVSKASKPITDAQGMKGLKIGVQDANELVWAALLKANGLSEKDLTRVPVQFDPSPLKNGEVDGFLAYVTNEPNTLRVGGLDVVTFLFADNKLPLVGESFTVTQASIDKDRAKIKAFLEAEIRGWKDAVATPDEAARLAVEVYGKDLKLGLAEQKLEMKDQVTLIVSPDTEANGIFTMTDALIAENIASLATAGIEITADKLFDLSLLKEVYAENPDLV